MSETTASEVSTPADTFLVIARFPCDDIPIEIKDTQEAAAFLALTIAKEPTLLDRDISECGKVMLGDNAPSSSDLGRVSVMRLLGGKIPMEIVDEFEA